MSAAVGGTTFPLSALVGADDVRLALVLAAVDPRIGGVLLRGDKGSGKTTAARGLAALLADGAPFVELPLGATEDRVVGSLDVRVALGTGEYAFRPGLLQAADGGVLYVDEVNLLPDHLVDLLLDAAATGVVRVERDGVSETRAARFVLVGSMNPEEGELRPQLLDRFGLSAAVGAPGDPAERAEAVRRRLAFDRDPAGEAARWASVETDLRHRLHEARPARVPDRLTEQVAVLCAAAGAEGLRADLVICRAAAALAGWEGRAEAGPEDVRRVAGMALAHRRSTPWETGRTADDGGGLDRLLDEALGDGSGPPPEPDGSGPPPEPDGSGSPSGAPDVAATPEASERPGSPSDRPGTEPPRSTGPLPDAGPSPAVGEERRRLAAVPGRRAAQGQPGRRSPGSADAGGGRLVGSRVPEGGRPPDGVHPTATVLAAVDRRAAAVAEPSGRIRIHPDDVREPVRRQPAATLVVMVVDASGSMGVRARVAAARSAVLALLVDAYQRRDRVALVTFRGDAAETVLRPTGSTEVARARLEGLATGGRTPLAAGLAEGLRVATGRRRTADRPLLVVVSDGRATAAPDGDDPVAAALAAAAEVRTAGVDALVVDCEGPQGARLGLAAELAAAMGARHVVATEVTGESLAAAVRGAVATG